MRIIYRRNNGHNRHSRSALSTRKAELRDMTTNNGNDVKVTPNCNVSHTNETPFCDTDSIISVEDQVISKSAESALHPDVNSAAIQDIQAKKDFECTAENITQSYMHGINMAKSVEQQLNAGPDSTFQNPPMVVNQENRQWELEGEVTSKEQIANNMIDSTLPVYTSTPILMRYEGNVLGNKSIASQNIFSVLSRIDQLDGNIKSIKREIIQQMERKLDELKISVVSMI